MGAIQDGDFEEAVSYLNHHQAIERSLDEATHYAHQAIESLSILDDEELKDALSAAALYTVSRTS